ncbi:hypothetical protein B9H02_09925 [Prosthecochloris sp. HL-130-GSB]|nr:hypothetical protein B9H02_09925 [Prosthecochloris sp. HL-130-GSB]
MVQGFDSFTGRKIVLFLTYIQSVQAIPVVLSSVCGRNPAALNRRNPAGDALDSIIHKVTVKYPISKYSGPEQPARNGTFFNCEPRFLH